jgi:putative membrane protein
MLESLSGAATAPPPVERLSWEAMSKLLVRWICNVIALFVAAWVLSGISYGDQWWTLFIAAAVFTLVNAWVKPVLAVLSIPFIVVTLGLFYFLINVLMLYLTDWIVPDFEIRTFWWGVLAAIIVSIVNGLLNMVLPDERPPARAQVYYQR